MYAFTLWDSPRTLSSPWATLIRELRSERAQVSDLISCSDPTEIFPWHIQSDWGVLQTADAFMWHLLGAGEGKRSLPVEWSLGGKVERRLGYTKGKYLAVSRFLLAVILVSGFQTAVQSQLLTVWVATCWCKKIISQSKVPPSLLHGIVSRKNKEKKCHWYLVSLKLW